MERRLRSQQVQDTGTKLAKRKPQVQENTSDKRGKSVNQESTRRSASETSGLLTKMPLEVSRRGTNGSRDKCMYESQFFTIREDNMILNYWLQKKGSQPVDQISQTIAQELPHTAESIRDRIKQYLSRLSNFDHEYIMDESMVN